MLENNKSSEDATRLLLEQAIRYGRSKQSPHTGYIHYCYQTLEEDEKSCIPLMENLLFALALFHTRTMENIVEGKELINKLLFFQCLEGEFSAGNFPVYLHEYPACKDRLLAVHLLPPFYWILKLYASVLGNELKKRLESAVLAALEHCLKAYRERKIPISFAMKIGAAAQGIGKLLQKEEIEHEGESIMATLSASHSLESWSSPAAIGDALIALQILYSDISSSPWSFLWDYLAKTWCSETCAYIGPPLKEFQYGKEPQPTLYDLFLGVFSGTFSQRAFLPQAFILQGVLIRAPGVPLPVLTRPYSHNSKINGGKWHVEQHERYAYTTFETENPVSMASDKGLHDFRLIWGSAKQLHTFVCQGGNRSHTAVTNGADCVEFTFTLGDVPLVEDREKSREAIFYFDSTEDQKIMVKGKKSTTFLLGEKIEVITDALKIQIHFELVEGSGDFFGHIMRGNRPSQVALRGENRYNAYDWQLFVRTLRRSEKCVIKAYVTFQPVEK